MSLGQDVRDELKKRMTDLGWKYRRPATYTKPLKDGITGYINFQASGRTGAVKMIPIIGLIYDDFMILEREYADLGSFVRPQVGGHIEHFFKGSPPGMGFMTFVDHQKLDWTIEHCLKVIDILLEKYPTLLQALERLTHWKSGQRKDSSIHDPSAVGAAFLGDFEKARSFLASWRADIYEYAAETGKPPHTRLIDKQQAIVDRLELEAKKKKTV